VSPTPDHWIKPNESSQVPNRFIFLDTEARTSIDDGIETQVWRCGVANFVHWTSKKYLRQRIEEYTDVDSLWTDVGQHTRKGSRTVVYCHNLPYDMRIGRLLDILPRHGWHLDNIRLDSRGSWSRWTRKKATLIFCDSASIFPCTLWTLGQLLGMGKLALPDDDNEKRWLARCRRDVEILSTAMLEYLGWLKTGAAGNWQMTGSSQAWSHWRHNHYTERVLIHHDMEAIAAERRALWTGRAENWRWGRDKTEPVYEYDWQNAYPRVARDCAVPTRYLGVSERVSPRALPALWERYAVLADVSVRVAEPIVPARHDEGILWPVGEFDTTLWDPELRLLAERGAIVRVRRVWMYQKGPALKDWAEWVLNGIHSGDVSELRWLPIVLKHWSRSLIGRFAMRYQTWNHFGTLPTSDIRVGTLVDRDAGTATDTMQVGHDFYTLSEFAESPNACPQITGYIMSEARAKLWRMIHNVGAENVYYMDTDSLVVNATGHSILENGTGSPDQAGLHLKDRSRGYEIYGPRALILGDTAKFAGMPRGAERTGDTTFLGEVWTGLERSVRTGEFDRVTIRKRPFTVRWNDKRRQRQPDGTTTPHRLPATGLADPAGRLPAITAAERVAALRRAVGGHQIDQENRAGRRRGRSAGDRVAAADVRTRGHDGGVVVGADVA
jgi:hypothetical protein